MKTLIDIQDELMNDLLKEAKKVFEREFIKRKLLKNNNNITKTAEAIGVERSYLHKKLKALNKEESETGGELSKKKETKRVHK